MRRGIPLERLVSEKKLVFLLTGLQITCKILLSVYFKVMNLLKGKGMIYKWFISLNVQWRQSFMF